MDNNLMVLSVHNGNQPDIVHQMDYHVQQQTHKENGVPVKDLTQYLLNVLIMDNLSVFQLEVGQIQLIHHQPLNKLPL